MSKDGKWMLDASRNADQYQEIAERAQEMGDRLRINTPDAFGVKGNPKNSADHLGQIEVNIKVIDESGVERFELKTVDLHMVHAVDPVLINESGTDVVVINRMFDPGQGLPALPGGFIDPPGAEHGKTIEQNLVSNPGLRNIHINATDHAIRELAEETGATIAAHAHREMVGERNFNRPFDIRVAANDSLAIHGIKKGDVFTVSTQASLIVIPDEEFARMELRAADDATPGSARKVPVTEIEHIRFGVQDHPDLIKQAVNQHHLNRARSLALEEISHHPASITSIASGSGESKIPYPKKRKTADQQTL